VGVASAADAALAVGTAQAVIAIAEAVGGATAGGTSATTEEGLVAHSPAKPHEVECIEVDSPDTVAVMATAAGVASDLASPMPPDGLAITGTPTPITATDQRTTHLLTTRLWSAEWSLVVLDADLSAGGTAS
jgi:hypothetical protein